MDPHTAVEGPGASAGTARGGRTTGDIQVPDHPGRGHGERLEQCDDQLVWSCANAFVARGARVEDDEVGAR